MCSILASPASRVLERGRGVTTLLNAYPLTWGHAVVVIDRHATRYTDVDAETAAESMRLIHAVARRIELSLAPMRVFVASLGSAREDLTMTSPHLHWHVVPVVSGSARAAEVLTWERGVLEGTVDEWDAIQRLLGADEDAGDEPPSAGHRP